MAMTPDQHSDIDRTVALGEEAAEGMHRAYESKPSRRDTIKIASAIAFVAMAIGIIAAIFIAIGAARSAAEFEVERQATLETVQQNRELAQDALERVKAANEILEGRGQEPVEEVEPNPDDVSEALANAATAQVLAELPDLAPDADEVGQAVAQYITQNPQGPSSQTLARLIADYFQENPPPAGEQGGQGPTGVPGRPPTEAEINAAVLAYCEPQGSDARPCRGPMGPAGTNGEDGVDGTDGEDGADGKDGGIPETFTFTTQSGIERKCTLVEGTGPTNPHYSCQRTGP